MKKLSLLALLIAAVSVSAFGQATTYKSFKVDLGMLYAIPAGDGVKAGIGFHIEPKYNITDNIAAGLRLEWAVMAAADVEGGDASVSALGSYVLTGDYYFGTETVRPFAGVGLGLYNLGTAEVSVGNNTASVDYGSKFGFVPRVGVLLGHFRLGLEYNVITGLEEGLSSKNYTSIKLGFEIGGGKR